MPQTIIVVPCFNEEPRFDARGFEALLRDERIDLLFVDDGSTDATARVLEAFVERHPQRARVLALPANRGKGEAVRSGLVQAIEAGASVVGYLDADLATPPEEMIRLLDGLLKSNAEVVLGARVQLLGSNIARKRMRHYLGRIFATSASFVLALPVYDTQCGAKLFRVTEPLRRAFDSPFLSRWAFDVELLSRLLVDGDGGGLPRDAFLEIPLRTWTDVAGSKLRPTTMAHSALELGRIAWHLRRRRNR